jgi:asparagine synthase (glutamine-hydrolysing)
MFAFGLWDQRRRLFLARDRVGKKPLYFAQRPGICAQHGWSFHFASELQGLLATTCIPRELDPAALDA